MAFLWLYSGHDCLRKHLHRIKLAPNPFCQLCNSEAETDIYRFGFYPALPPVSPLETLLDTRTYVDGLLMSIFTNCSLVFIALYPKVNFPAYLHLGKKKKKQIFNDQLFLIKCSPSPIKMSYYSPPRTQFPGLFYRQIVQKWIYVSA